MNTTRTAETLDQARVRLADKARQTGVQLKRDDAGRYWASSTSQPGHWHAVTGYSCDCAGFVSHGRCKHHSALLAALGWLPDPTPAPVALPVPTPCRSCAGRGFWIQARYGKRVDVVCPVCHGDEGLIAA
jgi:hypothetical protein